MSNKSNKFNVIDQSKFWENWSFRVQIHLNWIKSTVAQNLGHKLTHNTNHRYVRTALDIQNQKVLGEDDELWLAIKLGIFKCEFSYRDDRTKGMSVRRSDPLDFSHAETVSESLIARQIGLLKPQIAPRRVSF